MESSLDIGFIRKQRMIKSKEFIFPSILTLVILVLDLLEFTIVSFGYSMLRALCYLLFACCLIFSIIRLIRNPEKSKVVPRILPLTAVLLMMVLLYGGSEITHTDGGKKRLMVIGFNHDLYSINCQLFKDGTFKLFSAGPFGGENIRGRYTLINDTLEFMNEKLHDLYPSGKLAFHATGSKPSFVPTTEGKQMYALQLYQDFRTTK